MKRLKSYEPKGYAMFVFADGSTIVSKNYIQGSLCVVFNVYYTKSTDAKGYFDSWSKHKGIVEVYTPVSRVYHY